MITAAAIRDFTPRDRAAEIRWLGWTQDNLQRFASYAYEEMPLHVTRTLADLSAIATAMRTDLEREE